MITMFEGFTEAEIKSVANKVSSDYGHSITKSNQKYKQSHFGSISREIVRAKRKSEIQRKARESRLPSPKEEEEYEEEKKEVKVSEKSVPDKQQREANLTEAPSILKSHTVMQEPLTTKPDVAAITNAPVDFDDSIPMKALDKFEENQRKLEAFNSERKEQLRQALSDRAKKTHEEVKKLNQIEEELKKLDSCLSNDVYILRNEIESASHDFMEAQKRFNRAEKEYVEAKMELFTKKERKELLTSHLCSIIEQNELRKAKKLSDLMEKLEVPSKPLPVEVPNSDIKDEQLQQNSNGTS